MIRYAGDEFFTLTTPSGHDVKVDVKNGRRAAAGPLELFIGGLASCTAADVISILQKKREQVSGYHVEVRAHRRDEYPRAFVRIELKHVVRGKQISADAVQRAIDLSTNKYCSAIATVRATAEIVTNFEIVEG